MPLRAINHGVRRPALAARAPHRPGPSLGWHGLALVLAVFPLASPATAQGPPLESDVFPALAVVPLRLDRGLAASSPATADNRPPASVTFGLSLLHNRVVRTRQQARSLEQEQLARAAELAGRERQVDDLRALLAHQDQLLGMLQTRVDEAGQRRSQPGASPPSASSPGRSPASTPVIDGGWGLDTLIQAGVLMLITSLLGWVLVLRSRLASARVDAEDEESPVAASTRLQPSTPSLPPASRDVVPDWPQADPPPAPARGPDEADMPRVTAPMPTTMTSPAGTGPLGGVSGRGGADPRLLKEIDTLIAFEDYAQAASMLRDLIDRQPRNAEYRLRLLHVESATGNEQASEVEEEILASIMMDGPLSATINRVLCAGRDMLPGHPLFSGTPWDAPAEEVPRSAADGAPTIELEQPRRAPSQD